ncbi:hypothetical protein GCM10009558_099270 [Virgisporangium aurantiacum]
MTARRLRLGGHPGGEVLRSMPEPAVNGRPGPTLGAAVTLVHPVDDASYPVGARVMHTVRDRTR